MANEASGINYSKLTVQQIEEYLKRPNLSQNDQERLLDELIRRTTDELISKTQANSDSIAQPQPPDNDIDTPKTKNNEIRKPEHVETTSQQQAKPASTLKRIAFFVLAAILSFVGIILLLVGLTGSGDTTLYGIICLGVAFWLFNSR